MSVREWCIEKIQHGNTIEWLFARSIKLILEVAFSLLFGLIFGWLVQQTIPAQARLSMAGMEATVGTIETAAVICTVLIWVNSRCDYAKFGEE